MKQRKLFCTGCGNLLVATSESAPHRDSDTAGSVTYTFECAPCQLRFQVAQQVTLAGMMVVVHSVHEIITVVGEKRPRPAVVATNVYLRTAAGWRMIVHHTSPAPGASSDPPPEVPKILH